MPTRRTTLTLLSVAAVGVIGGGLARAQTTPPPQTAVRKDASRLTPDEIERFKTAYQALIDDGTLNRLIATHADPTHLQHEAAVASGSLALRILPRPGGRRFLPWHRAQLLAFEGLMRQAVAGKHGPEAAAAFALPYWNYAAAADMPAWIKAYRPRGMKAARPDDLAQGHAGFAAVRGQTHAVVIERWPGTYAIARTLPPPEMVADLLKETEFRRFVRRLEWAPALRTGGASVAVLATQTINAIAQLQGREPSLTILSQFASANTLPDEAWEPLAQAMARVAALAAGEEPLSPALRQQFTRLAELIGQRYLLAPHLLAQTWAAGHAPGAVRVRGTLLNDHEKPADPLYWLLAANTDRLWSSWSTRNKKGAPDLKGPTASFTPLAGGSTYKLAELVNEPELPYRYDALV